LVVGDQRGAKVESARGDQKVEIRFRDGSTRLRFASRLAERSTPYINSATTTRVIVATGRYVGEGFDDPKLDTLFLAMPISWKGTVIQYAGRIQRLHSAKREVRIYDYVDRNVPVLEGMFRRCLAGYRSIGYVEGELPLGYEADDDWTLGRGWDEDLDENAAGDIQSEGV
jgi:hypothetical protein